MKCFDEYYDCANMYTFKSSREHKATNKAVLSFLSFTIYYGMESQKLKKVQLYARDNYGNLK